MLVAVVRYIETQEAMGIFWGPTISHIADQVDEYLTPFQVEYKLLNEGAILFGAEAQKLPFHVTGNDEGGDAVYEEGRHPDKLITSTCELSLDLDLALTTDDTLPKSRNYTGAKGWKRFKKHEIPTAA